MLELLSIKTFLDDINRGDIKNKKNAQKNFRVVKESVSSEVLKEIVIELEKAIFGPGESGDENYQESIGERVKLKNQNKISDKEFKENYATEYDDLDKIDSLVVEKKYGADNEDMIFAGFKKVLDGYKNGIISKKDIYDKYTDINNNTYRDNIYSKNNKLIASGYREILFLINNDMIKLDEEKILDSIKDANKNLYNKDYITKDNSDNVIPSKYTGY